MLTSLIRLAATFTVFLPCFVIAAVLDATVGLTLVGRTCERVVHFVINGR